MKIVEAHNLFLADCQNGRLRQRSSVTLANYRNAFRVLIKWFPSLREVSSFNEDIARRFLRRGEEQNGWKPASVVAYRKNLGAFIEWCKKHGHLESDPFQNLPWPLLAKGEPQYYVKEEIEKLMWVVSIKASSNLNAKRDQAILAVLLLAGLRRGELISLKITDVDLGEECLRIRAETAKNRSSRTIKMTFRLKEILQDYWKARQEAGIETPWFWISTTYKNHRLTKDGLKHLVDRLSRLTGFRFKPHKCRHTFATEFYEASHDIVGLQAVLGHKDITTTMVYTSVKSDHLAASMEKNPLNQMI